MRRMRRAGSEAALLMASFSQVFSRNRDPSSLSINHSSRSCKQENSKGRTSAGEKYNPMCLHPCFSNTLLRLFGTAVLSWLYEKMEGEIDIWNCCSSSKYLSDL